MRRFLIALLLLAPALAQAPSQLIPNLTLVKEQVEHWVSSGEYARECETINARARAYLEANLAGVKRPALVLDIDETSLSNYPLMLSEDFGFEQARFDAWVAAARTPPIPSTLELFRYAESRQVACFFITGRGEALRESTEKDLRNAGYSDWEGLYLKPEAYKESSIVGFKSGVRRQLTDQGYEILVNVGDQMSDLEGGYAQSFYKLPNPMYFIP
ncbi:acid phosphatase [bacterium CPR1]|nr:acid phosphatase [bacterium CPR1]